MSKEDLLVRLERLEKQNRNFRMAGILLFACVLAIIAMGQKKPATKTNYRAIEASAVSVKDQRGTDRIKILPKGIEFYDSEGKFAGAIREGVTILNEVKVGRFSIFDGNGRDRMLLAINAQKPSIQMLNEGGVVRTAVGQEAIVLIGNSKDEYNTITYDRMSIRDTSSATATVGVTETLNKTSGAQSKTSAGTITLFGKDGKVIWQAP